MSWHDTTPSWWRIGEARYEFVGQVRGRVMPSHVRLEFHDGEWTAIADGLAESMRFRAAGKVEAQQEAMRILCDAVDALSAAIYAAAEQTVTP